MNSLITEVGGMPVCSFGFIAVMYERNLSSLKLSEYAGEFGEILLKRGSA